MRKRLFPSLALTALLALLLAGCGSGGKATTAQRQGQAASDGADFRIGLMTGTVSQGEDEFRAGQQLQRKYGNRLRHVTYPDNFMNEQETVIAQLVGLAADPKVKLIVIGQAIPGSIAATRKIREQRPDILVGFFQPHEDPAIVNVTADLAIQPDELARGRTIIAESAAMGAKSFVHYSFPRHMSQELLSRRRDIMRQAAAEKGMSFHFVTAPDPMAEGGLPATQQFVLEDQPRELKKLGPETAFFSTNCGMQEPLIKSVLMNGGYIAEQCCPSPTHGYPGALGIAIPPDKVGDMDYINAENKRVIAQAGRSGHFGTWPVPEAMVSIRAMTNLLVDAVDQKADYKDPGTVQKYLEQEAGAKIEISKYDPNTGNQYLFLIQQIVY
jgi:hypothetical protein